MKIKEAMLQLTQTLHEQCIDTGLITKEQWNKEIAPKMCSLGMAIDGVNVTSRSYEIIQTSAEMELELRKIFEQNRLKKRNYAKELLDKGHSIRKVTKMVGYGSTRTVFKIKHGK